jgi:hypothetical protein
MGGTDCTDCQIDDWLLKHNHAIPRHSVLISYSMKKITPDLWNIDGNIFVHSIGRYVGIRLLITNI